MDISRQAPSFRFVKRTVAVGMMAATVVLATAVERKEGEVKVYVDQNLENIIQEQEKNIGIQYPEELPRIHYYVPEDVAKMGSPGSYDYKTNNIHLQSAFLEPPEWDFSTAKDTIHHELAHYYMDKLSERLVDEDWPKYEDDMTLAQMLGIKLISEGTATYIERKMNGQEDTFTDKDWPKGIRGFVFHPLLPYPKNEIIYYGGFHLVKPVIDQYEEEGIIYLMFNPPQEHEMLNLPLYQQRMLEELSDI